MTYSYDTLSRYTGVWHQVTERNAHLGGYLVGMGPANSCTFTYDDFGRPAMRQLYPPSANGAADYRQYEIKQANRLDDDIVSLGPRLGIGRPHS